MSVIPRELSYIPPVTLSGIESREIRIQVQQLTSQMGQSGSVLQFQIPEATHCFIDPSTASLSLTVQVVLNTKSALYSASGSTTSIYAGNAAVRGSGLLSMFSKIETYFNSSLLIDQVTNVDQYANIMRNISQNGADQLGDSACWGGGEEAYPTLNNVAMPLGSGGVYSGQYDATADTMTQSIHAALPVPGYLGAGSAGRLIPQLAGPHLFQCTINNPTDWIYVDGTNYLSIASVTVTRAELVFQQIQLSEDVLAVVKNSLPVPGQLTIRSNAVVTNVSLIPSGQSGTVDLLLAGRATSVKGMLTLFVPASAADGKFASVNPSIQEFAYNINSQFIPQQQMSFARSPADGFYRLLQGMGVWSTTNGKPSFAQSTYFTALTTGVPSAPFRAYRATGAPTDKTAFSDCFCIFQDCEFFGSKGSGSGFYSGVNTKSGSSFLHITFAAATSVSITAVTFGLADQLVSYDLLGKTCMRVL